MSSSELSNFLPKVVQGQCPSPYYSPSSMSQYLSLSVSPTAPDKLKTANAIALPILSKNALDTPAPYTPPSLTSESYSTDTSPIHSTQNPRSTESKFSSRLRALRRTVATPKEIQQVSEQVRSTPFAVEDKSLMEEKIKFDEIAPPKKNPEKKLQKAYRKADKALKIANKIANKLFKCRDDNERALLEAKLAKKDHKVFEMGEKVHRLEQMQLAYDLARIKVDPQSFDTIGYFDVDGSVVETAPKPLDWETAHPPVHCE